MSTTTSTPGLFHLSQSFRDMDAWHAEVAELRRTDPVHLVDEEGWTPYWALTRHADVFAVSRDHHRWKNTVGSVLGSDADGERMMASGILPKSLVHLDDEAHTLHRQVTNDWFKPAVVKNRQPRINEIADLFIDRMRELGGECDFASDIAQPYTLRVIMDIYGVPESDEALMLELTQGVFGANDPEFLGDAEDAAARAMQSVFTFIQYFNGMTADRRACPADDLASVIANGQINGCPMGDEERLWYYIIVATAGHDTTSFALSGGIQALLANPEQIDPLRHGGDEGIVHATDEFIRWTTPVRHFMRYAAEDTSVGGVDIPAGGRVLLSYPSANRDEAVFADPMRFDVTRTDADRLLSFGVGTHFCLGAQFARREIRTFLAKLLDQVAEIETTGSAAWSESHFVSGVKHLPIRYRFK